MIGNSKEHYGFIHIFIHWLMALIIFAMFASGLYMETLTPYDPGYHSIPLWHKSFGIILAALLVLRLVWLIIQPKPLPLPNHQRWEIGLAHATHSLLYLLILAMIISGYIIATAKGNSINVFNSFSIPSLIDVGKQTRLFGKIHFFSAWGLIGLAAFHALGALKHAVLDRDGTLKRMLWPK